jgi:hypothetical protein
VVVAVEVERWDKLLLIIPRGPVLVVTDINLL